eukprot:NODE_967_length_1197_cov_126.135017_g729_i0.p4 GENE.NODE_967_length_1197_cov_126.135017_g729_i0~~NODE_967_length_1197_cov_126.135017_g729_i0.p4  ORF type:complete len:91 (+),score=12.56 NODE_967_length_1197_cov_126.135017_g729_i0:488-760(+)
MGHVMTIEHAVSVRGGRCSSSGCGRGCGLVAVVVEVGGVMDVVVGNDSQNPHSNNYTTFWAWASQQLWQWSKKVPEKKGGYLRFTDGRIV